MSTPLLDDFHTITAELRSTTRPSDLFGPADPAAADHARRRFRSLAGVVHPDRADAATVAEATVAFGALNDLWNDWLAAAGLRTAFTTITTAKHRYEVGARRYAGEICDLYDATYTDGDGAHPAVMKFPRAPQDNDLLATEARALRRLASGDVRFRPYVPELVDSFAHRDVDDGTERRATVLPHLDGFVTLEAVRAAHPAGLDPRDAAWLWRRLLVAIGYVHRNGVVHAAVLPEHVLIHPERHGLVLVDFCYAATSVGDRLTAIPTTRRDWYPAEVATTRRVEPSLDIYLGSRLMRWLMADRAPRPMRRFIDGCTVAHDRLRPSDAWRLLDELDEILGDLYGPRRFRPFVMP